MRITNNMLTNNFMNNYNQSLSKVSKLQNQLDSGKAIDKPSDDPVKKVRSLNFYTGLSTNDMFSQNASDAISWMSTSDGAINSIVDNITSIRTLVVNASSTNPKSSYDAISTQVDKAIDELVDLGNTQIGGRYIFGGQADRTFANGATQPFTRDSATGVVTYNGTWDGQATDNNSATSAANPTLPNAGTICMKVSPGAPDPIRDKINVDGQSLFGTMDTYGDHATYVGTYPSPPLTVPAQPAQDQPQPAIFQHLNQIKADIKSGNTANLTQELKVLDDDLDTVISAQTTMGSRMAVYQNIQGRLTSDNVTIKSDLSTNEDLDQAKASIDITEAMNVYNSALAVGARVLPNSLVDYLK